MLTGNFIHIETDKKEQEKIVQLYNIWMKNTSILSSINLNNEYWLQLKEYCENHKDIAKEFFIDLVDWTDGPGHFTLMMNYLFPGEIEPLGYVPINCIADLWYWNFNHKWPERIEKSNIMVGDWVELKVQGEYRSKYVQVDAITNMNTIITKPDGWDEGFEIELYKLKPIKLTKELLIKNHWKYNEDHDDYSGNKHLYVKGDNNPAQSFMVFEYVQVHYVHELQHAMKIWGDTNDFNMFFKL